MIDAAVVLIMTKPSRASRSIFARAHDSKSTRSSPSRFRKPVGLSIIAVLAICLSAALASEPFLPEDLLSRVKEQFGRRAERTLIHWQNFIIKNADKSEERKLKLVNLYFNVIPYASDSKQWGVKDYWSTPVELLVHDRGDCEDYAIAKYFTLRKLGVAAEKLRVIYVRVNERTRRSRVGNGLNDSRAHMVLGYYESPTSPPLILDNLTRAIKPASERPDLEPIFSNNSDDLIKSMLRRRGADIKFRDVSEEWYAFMLRI
ncbi:MAG: sulfate adenylyltransferase [Proteobacteria bacterium]|nr:MAG: sulfate adenylyltransferase [Pseudomonadota bacterium]